jgi:hypothetical protein
MKKQPIIFTEMIPHGKFSCGTNNCIVRDNNKRATDPNAPPIATTAISFDSKLIQSSLIDVRRT